MSTTSEKLHSLISWVQSFVPGRRNADAEDHADDAEEPLPPVEELKDRPNPYGPEPQFAILVALARLVWAPMAGGLFLMHMFAPRPVAGLFLVARWWSLLLVVILLLPIIAGTFGFLVPEAHRPRAIRLLFEYDYQVWYQRQRYLRWWSELFPAEVPAAGGPDSKPVPASWRGLWPLFEAALLLGLLGAPAGLATVSRWSVSRSQPVTLELCCRMQPLSSGCLALLAAEGTPNACPGPAWPHQLADPLQAAQDADLLQDLGALPAVPGTPAVLESLSAGARGASPGASSRNCQDIEAAMAALRAESRLHSCDL
ncbi:hypothetical protein H696_02610 [Fonticula alba]|uniref:Transmembrane protein n=1 Tax=Fonticula alba TaxID=691883 RepID=A0A058Z7M3_FONAL|nr:hypothetical protein H696_02610 [Fonticula alba]KCV70280.1 hypothetical protein H696_02610 [Fonticula alba]|eukprot:XP_009494796.1 hypothetical protein H696_02610 [Fonticula alba]